MNSNEYGFTMGYYVQTTRSYKTIFVCPLLADNQKWLLIPLKYDRNNQATTTSNDKSNKKNVLHFCTETEMETPLWFFI